jgi:hypothetical protein
METKDQDATSDDKTSENGKGSDSGDISAETRASRVRKK